ncbi:MAG: NADH-quinone oxidoreductase subunit H [Phycisphaerales bacterium]|nr:NADH-quinone oxidoreductase subunit H [Phycisphaerales bacterium]MCB9857786.1 NADH-quinone oxidoreductase subunit H [Phycisphaerales bacterium]MCB9863846.1 NADH-quinone oxidoreductase subunit H [Phycisphaerales bacterium]
MALIRAIIKHPILSGLLAVTIGGIVVLTLIVAFLDQIKWVLSDQFWFSNILSLAIFGGIMTAVAYCILLERKISAWIQDRYGPNRVGPLGLLQPLADGVKLLLKEDITPGHVDKALFVLAPFMMFVVALIGFAVVPWGGTFRWPWMDADATPLVAQVASIDIAVIYLLAVGSMGVYGVVLGGWASNNKYAFYGAMRAAAQMISYEIPLGLVVLTAVITVGYLLPVDHAMDCLRLEGAVAAQAPHAASWTMWVVFYHPVAALLMFIAALAEANRAPFDLAEAEQELIGGFHTEYSAMKWAMFFLGEYAHMITSSAFMVCLFWGGYHLPYCTWLSTDESALAMLCRIGVIGAKIAIFIGAYMVVRWSLPRFRFDQLMRLAWKSLVPMGLVILAAQVLIVYYGWPQWISIVVNLGVLVLAAIASLTNAMPISGRQQSLLIKEKAAREKEYELQHAGV